MPHEKSDVASLWDMLQAARLVIQFVTGLDEAAFLASALVQSAVQRQIEIIGEAANRVSAPFRDSHPEIPWAKIIGQRHVLAHEYGEIDDRRIWQVAVTHVHGLIARLEPLVPAPPEAQP